MPHAGAPLRPRAPEARPPRQRRAIAADGIDAKRLHAPGRGSPPSSPPSSGGNHSCSHSLSGVSAAPPPPVRPALSPSSRDQTRKSESPRTCGRGTQPPGLTLGHPLGGFSRPVGAWTMRGITPAWSLCVLVRKPRCISCRPVRHASGGVPREKGRERRAARRRSGWRRRRGGAGRVADRTRSPCRCGKCWRAPRCRGGRGRAASPGGGRGGAARDSSRGRLRASLVSAEGCGGVSPASLRILEPHHGALEDGSVGGRGGRGAAKQRRREERERGGGAEEEGTG